MPVMGLGGFFVGCTLPDVHPGKEELRPYFYMGEHLSSIKHLISKEKFMSLCEQCCYEYNYRRIDSY